MLAFAALDDMDLHWRQHHFADIFWEQISFKITNAAGVIILSAAATREGVFSTLTYCGANNESEDG